MVFSSINDTITNESKSALTPYDHLNNQQTFSSQVKNERAIVSKKTAFDVLSGQQQAQIRDQEPRENWSSFLWDVLCWVALSLAIIIMLILLCVCFKNKLSQQVSIIRLRFSQWIRIRFGGIDNAVVANDSQLFYDTVAFNVSEQTISHSESMPNIEKGKKNGKMKNSMTFEL